MSEPVRFLTSLAQALATMSLYADGHPARARAAEASFVHLRELLAANPDASFSFLGSDVIYGQRVLRSLSDWDWSTRLAAAGIQRLEFADVVGAEDYHAFLEQVLARIGSAHHQPSPSRASKRMPIKFGVVGVRGMMDDAGASPAVEDASATYDIGEEADAVRWMHDEVAEGGVIPLIEAEAVVRSLSVAMHGDSQVVLPLLRLKEFDEYTTTHSLNVSVLVMGLAEYLGLPSGDVRTIGVAGMLHDLGKVRVPKDILRKRGKLSPEEWQVMRAHPVDGARIILESDHNLDLAAVVSFEHHIMINGGGYPCRHHRRDCHHASRLVHVCDVYDALRTRRPYRDAWEPEETLQYIERGIGTEFDPETAHAFVAMMRKWEPRLAIDSAAPAGAVEPPGEESPGADADADAAATASVGEGGEA